MHFDLDNPVAPAGLAAPAPDVEAEPPRFIAAHLRFRRAAKKLADTVKHPGIRRRIGARRPPDGRLINIDDLVDIFQPVNNLMPPRLALSVIQAGGDALIEDLVNQRAFAGAGDAGHQRQHAERKLHP